MTILSSSVNRRAILFSFLPLALSAAYLRAQQKETHPSASSLPRHSNSKSLNVRTPLRYPASQELKWAYRCSSDAACVFDESVTFMRLHLRAEGLLVDNSWFMLVKNRQGNVVERLTRESFWGNESASETWT